MSKEAAEGVNATDADIQEVVNSQRSALDDARRALRERLSGALPPEGITPEENEQDGTGEEPADEEADNALTPEELSDEDSASDDLEESDATDEDDDTGDVLSQIDLDSLTEDQRAELAMRLGSGMGKRIGALTSENKQKDQEIARLKAALSDGVKGVSDQDTMGFTSIDKLEDYQKKLDDTLDAYDDFLAGDEEFLELDGKQYDRKEIAAAKRQIRGVQRKLPQARTAIEARAEVKAKAEAALAEASEKFLWYGDGESKAYQEYEALMSRPGLAIMEQAAPELYAMYAADMLHVANDKAGNTAKPKVSLPRKKPSVKPGSTSAPSASKARVSSEIKRLQKIKEDPNQHSRKRVQAARQIQKLQLKTK